MTIVVGAPFSGKRLWVDSEIERRETDGEVGLLAIDYTSLYSAMVPGLSSVFRDQRVTDSGAARFAGWLLGAAIREAGDRELPGFVLTDSPRRALGLAAQIGGAPLVEVSVSQDVALKRSQRHVDLVKDLAPRAATKDGKAAIAKCRQMVDQYYRERDVLPAGTRQVTAPDIPSDRAIQFMWNAAIKAAKAGDTARRDKWKRAAQRALAARGIAA